jgi:GAF domain-containing protein
VAPREFTDSEVDFLVASASLIAGAIENAQLYDEMRQRVSELEQLTELAEAVAVAETLDVLGPELVRRARELLSAEAVRLYLSDPEQDRLLCRFAEPSGSDQPASIGLSELGPEVGRGSRSRSSPATSCSVRLSPKGPASSISPAPLRIRRPSRSRRSRCWSV